MTSSFYSPISYHFVKIENMHTLFKYEMAFRMVIVNMLVFDLENDEKPPTKTVSVYLYLKSSYNRASHVAGRVYGNRLLKRLISPPPKSQVMFASAFSWISDFFRIFGIHSFYATATLLNIWICVQWTDAADGGCGRGQCDVNIPSLSPRGTRSKAVANDYRHECHHGCGLWTQVYLMMV